MGYHTEYRLDVDLTGVPENTLGAVLDALKMISGYGSAFEISNFCESFGEICTPDSIKWYDHAEHMVTLSAQFPTVKLSLLCIGDDGDQYTIDALGGKTDMRQGSIVFPPRTLW